MADGKALESEEALVDLSTPSSSNAGVNGEDKGSDQRPLVDGKHGTGAMVEIEAATGKSSKNSMKSGSSSPKNSGVMEKGYVSCADNG
ncbi:hypothetical protein RIF29_00796 [Crotalaria pallida]|uniref:Uncharacterized protein n=1 Tax=Crotalaria pallida TaxID=3830 RepID=A0AAN9IW40_CROPI